jgi:hypothetical protein
MIITSKIRNSNSLAVPQGRYFINRRLQPTVSRKLTRHSPAGTSQSTSIRYCVVPAGLGLHTSFLVRKLKHTVNKVSSLRDLSGICSCLVVRKLKHTVNKVSSLRDLSSMCSCLVRKLKHTVNKVSSLRDLQEYGKLQLISVEN